MNYLRAFRKQLGQPRLFKAEVVETFSAVVSGTSLVGQQVSVSAPGIINPQFQWKLDGVAIVGATSSTYTIVQGDVGGTLTCTVSVTSAGRLVEVPAPITFLDTFGQVNSNLLADTDWTMVPGGNTATFVVANNVITTLANDGTKVLSPDVNTPDQYMELQLKTITDTQFWIMRSNPTATSYLKFRKGGDAKIYAHTVINGTDTFYADLGGPVTSVHDVISHVIANNFLTTYNNGSVLSANVAVPAQLTGTRQGLVADGRSSIPFVSRYATGATSLYVPYSAPAIVPTITRSANTVNEGGTVTFNLTGRDNSTVNVVLTGVIAADVVGGLLTRPVTLDAAGVGSFTVQVENDVLTEGAETLTATIVGTSVNTSVTIADTSLTPAPTLPIIAEYKFDEGTGQVVTDSFNDYDGVLGYATENTTADPTRNADGLIFTGSNVVTVPVNAAFERADVTVVAVIKVTTTSGVRNILARDDGSAPNRAYQFRLNEGKMEMIMRMTNAAGVNPLSATVNIVSNEFALLTYRIAANKRDYTARVNGSTVFSGTLPFDQVSSSGQRTSIGARLSAATGIAEQFNGAIRYVSFSEGTTDTQLVELEQRARTFAATQGITMPLANDLKSLTVSTSRFDIASAPGTVIATFPEATAGSVTGKTAGSSLSVTDPRVAISGNNIIVGLTASTAGQFNVTVTETLGTSSNSPRVTSIPLIATAISAPIWNNATKPANINLSLNDTTATFTATQDRGAIRGLRAIGVNQKVFFASEVTNPGNQMQIGVANLTWNPASQYVGSTVNSIGYQRFGDIYYNGASIQGSMGAIANGDVVQVAVDRQNNRIWFRRNAGNWNNSATANPATNVGGLTLSVTGDLYAAVNLESQFQTVYISGTSSFGIPAGFDPIEIESVTLNALTVSATPFNAATPAGTVIGTISGKTAGSTLSVSDTRVAISGTDLVVGSTPSVGGTYVINITETLAGATNTPRVSPVTITVNPTLNALTVSGSTFSTAAAAGTLIGTISGMTPGSSLGVADSRVAISGNNLVVGATSTPAGSITVGIVEILDGATNTPRTTNFTLTVTAAVAVNGEPVQAFTTVDDAPGAVIYDLDNLPVVDVVVPIDQTVSAVTTVDDEPGVPIIDLETIDIPTVIVADQELETVSTADDQPGDTVFNLDTIPSPILNTQEITAFSTMDDDAGTIIYDFDPTDSLEPPPPPPVIPEFIFEDTFTASARTLANYVSSDGNGIWIKHPTTEVGGDQLLSGDGTVWTSAALKASFFYNDFTPPSANYWVEGDMIIKSLFNGTTSLGITGRNDTSSQTYYGVRYTGTSLVLFRSVAGTLTTIGTHSVVLTLNQVYTVRLIMNGTQLSVMLDGVLVLGPITDTNVTAIGKIGTRMYQASTTDTLVSQGSHLTAMRAGLV